MSVNSIIPVVKVSSVTPVSPVTPVTPVATPTAAAPVIENKAARTPTGSLNWTPTAVNLAEVAKHVDAIEDGVTTAEQNQKEARIIELEKQLSKLSVDQRGDRYKLTMERDLLKSELASGTMPEPARATFLAQVGLSAQYKDLQWKMANAKNPTEVASLWDQIQALAPKVKNINPEDMLGLNSVESFNRVLDLWKNMPTMSKSDGYRAGMEIRLLQQEAETGKFSDAARAAYFSAVEMQADYQATQTRWLATKDPTLAAALWNQLNAMRPYAKSVHPEDLLGFKNAATLGRAVDLMNKMPTGSDGQDYRLAMDLKLLRQEDTFGPMPMAAKLQFVQEVNANVEIKDLYAKLNGTPTKAEASQYFARLQVLQAKARFADPEQMLGLADAATVQKISDLHAKMNPSDTAGCYKLGEEVALVRFEANHGAVSMANKALFHEKVDQVAAYKSALWAYINESDKTRAAAALDKMVAAKKVVNNIDPDLYLVAG